jgi:hypothetical protein
VANPGSLCLVLAFLFNDADAMCIAAGSSTGTIQHGSHKRESNRVLPEHSREDQDQEQ